jgi:hypothetical protein
MAPVRGIPADILALSVPIVFAAGAFTTMVYRVAVHGESCVSAASQVC